MRYEIVSGGKTVEYIHAASEWQAAWYANEKYGYGKATVHYTPIQSMRFGDNVLRV